MSKYIEALNYCEEHEIEHSKMTEGTKEEIIKLKENLQKFKENADNLQISMYVVENEAHDKKRAIPTKEEIEELEKNETELAKNIAYSLYRLTNGDNIKIAIIEEQINKFYI